MFVQALMNLTRPSRALSCLALILCILLQAPMFLLWYFFGPERRADALRMTAQLAAWAGVIVGDGPARGAESGEVEAPPRRSSGKAANQPVGPPPSRPPRSPRAKAEDPVTRRP